MHIFLTGEIQVGKSTVIAEALKLVNISYGGFKTYFGPDRSSEDRLLYMNAAEEQKIFTKENGIVHFKKDSLPEIMTEKFEIRGVELIRSAKANAHLIVMDECGNLEQDAFEFQNEIIKTLDSKKPVLGVIKLASTGWTDRIRKHPRVKLITVTLENRNELPGTLADLYFKNKRIKNY